MTFPPLLDYFQVCGVFNCFTRKRWMRDKCDNRTMLRTANDTIMSSYLPFFQTVLIYAERWKSLQTLLLKVVSNSGILPLSQF